jgi:SAM-dependent methyltransferase
MSARDVYEFINEQDEATVQSLVNRLEFRGRDATFSQYRDAYLDRMGLPEAAAVLDVGCGTGVLARALARRPGFAGPISAVDQSPGLIDSARRLATEEGVSERIAFHVGDVHRLEFAAGEFDVVIAHTLVSHVSDPLVVLQEAARVVRPGGTVAVFDGDYASWTFGCSDPALGKTMEEGIVAAVVAQPRVRRDMPRLLGQAGLKLGDLLSFVYADVGKGRFFPTAAEAYAPIVARAGLVPADRVETWLAEQRQTVEQGTFFAACNYYAYLANR